jgi:hypothetical protein
MHGRALKTDEVDAAISDADTFPHQLSELIILTTAPDDVAIHDHIIALNRQRLVDGLPRVTVWGWNTICEHIGRYEDIQREFFSYWFHGYPVTRWAIVVIASIALAALSAIVFNSYRQYLRDSENGRISAIRELQMLAAEIEDLSSEYANCRTAMEESSFLSAAKLHRFCADQLAKRLTSIRRQAEASASVLDVKTWQQIKALVAIMAQDYRFVAFAVQMTRDYENQVMGGLPFLCPAKRARRSQKMTVSVSRDAAQGAANAQLYFYFLLRDFVPPEMDGIQARAQIYVRSAQLAPIPPDIIKSANNLVEIQKQRSQFQFREWTNPFAVFQFKFMSSRQISMSPDAGREEMLWNGIFLESLNRAVADRPEDTAALIACGILKQGFRPPAIHPSDE